LTNHILIVDSDEAFATILKEGIEMADDNRATIVTSAEEARAAASRENLAMAIVDLGLEDQDATELLSALREQDPGLRLMVIPVEDVPQPIRDLGIQGTLPKPFFLPNIPAQIEQALSHPLGVSNLGDEAESVPVSAPVPPTPAGDGIATEEEPEQKPIFAPQPRPSAELLAHLANESQRLADHLRYLSRELNADAVLLTCGADLLAYAGHFGRAEAERLAQTVSESWQASARVAAALGREQVRFEQSLHEGKDYLLYSVAAGNDIVLSVALRSDRPLGIIRYNTKQTAKELEPVLRLR
jgi:predicted regulator of Ras-like GTPase activity (Roadblock/LC7/MglB family)